MEVKTIIDLLLANAEKSIDKPKVTIIRGMAPWPKQLTVLSKTDPLGMFNQLKHNPKTTAHTGGKSAIFLKAVLIVPPNFKIKTNDNSKNMHNVAISQKIALKKPA